MKKHLPIILATLFIICVFTGHAYQGNLVDQGNLAGQRNLIGQSNSLEQRNISNTNNTSNNASESRKMQDDSFTEEDYQKLLALRFDGYKRMTISNFKNCVAELTDTAEYGELLERFSKSEVLYERKDTNEIPDHLYKQYYQPILLL